MHTRPLTHSHTLTHNSQQPYPLTHTLTPMHVRTHIHTLTHWCLHAHSLTYTHTHAYLSTFLLLAPHSHSQPHTCTHTHTHTDTLLTIPHTHSYLRLTHTHVHTHTPTHCLQPPFLGRNAFPPTGPSYASVWFPHLLREAFPPVLTQPPWASCISADVPCISVVGARSHAQYTAGAHSCIDCFAVTAEGCWEGG